MSERDDTDLQTDESPEPRPRQKKRVDGLVSPMDLASETLNEFIADLGPFALLGVGQLIAALVAVAFIVPLGVGCLLSFGIGGTVLGSGLGASEDELAAFGAIFGMIGYFVMIGVIVFGISVVLAPITGSVLRSVDDHLHDVAPASLGGAFDTAGKQLGLDIGTTVATQLLIVLALVVPIVGPLIAGFFLVWGPLASHLDGDGIGTAIKKSITHTRQHLTWHLSYYGLALVFGLVGGNIPVIGPMAAVVFHVKAYRAAFPRQPDPTTE